MKALLGDAVVRVLPAVPRPVVWKLASRYIAGPSLDDAIRIVRALNAAGKLATVDVLGEEATAPDETFALVAAYCDALERIEAERLRSNVSVKLTGLGLHVGKDLCRTNLEEIIRDAAARGNFVRIDMEDSATTEQTLALHRELRDEGIDRHGVVIQACLRRAVDDVPGLQNVRLCKGVYAEPEEIAFRDPDEVRASFVRCLELLVDQGAYVGIATHDEYLIRHALRIVGVARLPRDRYEFQMLLGVRTDRADRLAAAGHVVRIYVPYGTRWYEYAVRRLQENPRVAGHLAADLARRLFPWGNPSRKAPY